MIAIVIFPVVVVDMCVCFLVFVGFFSFLKGIVDWCYWPIYVYASIYMHNNLRCWQTIIEYTVPKTIYNWL